MSKILNLNEAITEFIKEVYDVLEGNDMQIKGLLIDALMANFINDQWKEEEPKIDIMLIYKSHFENIKTILVKGQFPPKVILFEKQEGE